MVKGSERSSCLEASFIQPSSCPSTRRIRPSGPYKACTSACQARVTESRVPVIDGQIPVENKGISSCFSRLRPLYPPALAFWFVL